MTHAPAPSTRLSRPLRLVPALWVVVGVAISVRTAVSPDRHTVYPVFLNGAAHWLHDEPVYADYKPLDYFRYPPVFAVAFAPLAPLDLVAGGVLWAWLNLAVYGAGLWAFARRVLPVTWT